MTGAEFENQTHLQPLPLGGRAAEQNSTCYIFREKKNINDVDDLSYIRLAHLKFELTKQNSAGGRKLHCPAFNVSYKH